MKDEPPTKGEADALDAQRQHWETTFLARPRMFGRTPSYPAGVAARRFAQAGAHTVLELGAGQGRDGLFFVQSGFRVWALDYSDTALRTLRGDVETLGLSDAVTMVRHDVRLPLPFADGIFDACYSHMLYCMALTEAQLDALSGEICRVLKPGGLNVYTVRNTDDPDFGIGIHRSEKLYEDEGFIVHFFDRELVVRLAKGYDLLGIEDFEEGPLPRRLFLVTMRKTRSR